MTDRRMMVLSLSMLAFVLPMSGQEGPKQSFEVTSTEHAAFAAGGIIRLQNSYGYLTVEGWDEPEVEVIVTRSTDGFYPPRQKTEAIERLNRVKVSAESRSAKEVTITTDPARKKLLIVSWPFPKKRGVTAEYTVHVPRDSRLEIQHDNGYVWVSDITGDIQVHSHTGDMIVLLPDPGPYAIDAQTRVGSVSSDFTGQGHKLLPTGTRFAYAGQTPARRVNLRMGRGSITILNGAPSGPFWKN
jgi:hypothetical protein